MAAMAVAAGASAARCALPVVPSRRLRAAPVFPSAAAVSGWESAPLYCSSGVPRLRRHPKASVSGAEPSSHGEDVKEMLDELKIGSSNPETSFVAKLALAVGVAVTATFISIYLKQPSSGPSFILPSIGDTYLSQSVPGGVGFTLSFFGRTFIIPQYAPGWVYFWLLMAAGCGLFISEEALNVWVGISIARTLSFDGTLQSLINSFSTNSYYIVSTLLWVYWGVCISDLIPFYLGKLFSRTNTSKDLSRKLGIGKEKALSITKVIQKYGNLIGFVERFSIGVRNPTAFLAGACGISTECFFAGVCCGGLITLPMQLAVGFLLRERPAVALGTVAAAVGIWTIFPYAIAASTALFLFIRRSRSS